MLVCPPLSLGSHILEALNSHRAHPSAFALANAVAAFGARFNRHLVFSHFCILQPDSQRARALPAVQTPAMNSRQRARVDLLIDCLQSLRLSDRSLTSFPEFCESAVTGHLGSEWQLERFFWREVQREHSYFMGQGIAATAVQLQLV